jgi:5-methylcytosine-specific restriction endonuclease McrA
VRVVSDDSCEKRNRNGIPVRGEIVRLRRTPEARREFIRAVRRDRKRCERCGAREGLTVHHVLPRSTHPYALHDLSNVIVLCQECHGDEHNGAANAANEKGD